MKDLTIPLKLECCSLWSRAQGAETYTKLVRSLECYDEVRWERAKPRGRGPIRKPVRNGHLVQNSNANSELFDSQVLEYRPRRERKGKLLRGGGK